MSKIVLHEDFQVALLEDQRAYFNTLEMRLLGADPGDLSTYVFSGADEVTDSGYSSLVGAGFTAVALNGSNEAEMSGPAWTTIFDHNAGDVTIYAAIWTDPADSDKFVFGQKEDTPPVIVAAGQSFTVVPRYTRRTQP